MKVILDSTTKILPLVNKSIAIVLGLIDENNVQRDTYIDSVVEKESNTLWRRLGIRLKYEHKEMKYDKAIKMLFSLQHQLHATQNLLSDENHRIELDGEEIGLIQTILDGRMGDYDEECRSSIDYWFNDSY